MQEPEKRSSNIYGDTVVESGGHAILGDVVQDVRFAGGVHLHYHFQDVRALHNAVDHLRPSATNTAQCSRILGQLEALGHVLQQAEQVVAYCNSADRQHAATLHAVATSTAITLKDFTARFEGFQRSATSHEESGRSNSDRDHMVDCELGKLQQYLTVQMLCMNGVFGFMQ